MKHYLFLTAILWVSISVNAQITITQNDFGPLGMTLTLADDTMPSPSMDLGTPGTDKIWDFTMLNNDVMYQYQFINVANTPFATTFANANMAIAVSGGYYYYLNLSSDSLVAVGQSGDFLGIGNAVAIKLNPSDIILEFPSNYLSSFISNMSFDEVFHYGQLVSGYQVDSIRYKSITHKTSIIDAWGTVTTDEGSFPSLRQNTENEVTDTVWGLINLGLSTMWVEFETDYEIENTYSWYANAIGMPIVEITYDTATNTAISASCVLPSLTFKENDAMNVAQSEFLKIYPNPAQDIVYINNTFPYEKCTVTVFDVLGKKVKQMNLNNNQNIEIPVTDLNNGLYLFEIKIDDRKTVNYKIMKK